MKLIDQLIKQLKLPGKLVDFLVFCNYCFIQHFLVIFLELTKLLSISHLLIEQTLILPL